jgi:hypothetical protein
VPAAIGLAGVLGAAATRAAGDDTADRAQLHPRIVGGDAGAVYSPAVLVLGSHGGPSGAGPEWCLAIRAGLMGRVAVESMVCACDYRVSRSRRCELGAIHVDR